MPGKKSYGPAGKWIHDRAHGIMDKRKSDLKDRYGEKEGKSIAYAIATQQAHKVRKSPKGFRTKSGFKKALWKHDRPMKEYRKTASVKLAALFDELELIKQAKLFSKLFKVKASPTEGVGKMVAESVAGAKKLRQAKKAVPRLQKQYSPYGSAKLQPAGA